MSRWENLENTLKNNISRFNSISITVGIIFQFDFVTKSLETTYQIQFTVK